MIPRLDSFSVAIAFAHRAWALVVAALVFATIAAAARSGRKGLRRAAMVLGAIVIAQIALGASTVLSRRGVAITTAHVATGALLLGTAVALAVGSLARPRLSAVLARPGVRKVTAWK